MIDRPQWITAGEQVRRQRNRGPLMMRPSVQECSHIRFDLKENRHPLQENVTMAGPRWIPITGDPQQEPFRQRFVEMMRAMDVRYHALTVKQFTSWFTNSSTYPESVLFAYGWVSNEAAADKPSLIEAVVLERLYKMPGRPPRAELLMLGWLCGPELSTFDRMDLIIDQLFDQSTAWLSEVNKDFNFNLTTINAVRPNTMSYEPMQQLHDRIYARTSGDNGNQDARMRLVRKRNLGDAWYWAFAPTMS